MSNSGFIAIVGRPNVGKSSLLNTMLGEKVSIVSSKAQTTRAAVRGVLTNDDNQIVFVDTPGIHKPQSTFGDQLNQTARGAIDHVDAVLFVVDAESGIGEGDERLAKSLPLDKTICVVNKCDRISSARIAEQLALAGAWNCDEYFPVSARTGKNVEELVEILFKKIPDGPMYYGPEVVRDVPDAFWVAELVREQVLRHVEEELPHSVACEVTEWEWPRIRCEILVQRNSQKAIVIGNKGERLKQIGIAAREQLPEGCYLDLFVKVEPDWPRRLNRLSELGYVS